MRKHQKPRYLQEDGLQLPTVLAAAAGDAPGEEDLVGWHAGVCHTLVSLQHPDHYIGQAVLGLENTKAVVSDPGEGSKLAHQLQRDAGGWRPAMPQVPLLTQAHGVRPVDPNPISAAPDPIWVWPRQSSLTFPQALPSAASPGSCSSFG